MEQNRFSEIRFVMAESLPKNLLAISPVTTGLVALKVSINSFPKYEIDKVDSPTEYIENLGKEEGLTKEVLNKGLENAFETKED